MHFVIVAGGQGTRLWPQSRICKLKQFHSLDGKHTFLQQSAERVLPLGGCKHIYIVTGENYVPLVMEQLPELPTTNIVIEPLSKNTAPSLALAAAKLRKRQIVPTSKTG